MVKEEKTNKGNNINKESKNKAEKKDQNSNNNKDDKKKTTSTKKSAAEIAQDTAKAAKNGEAPKTFGLKKSSKKSDKKSKFGVGSASDDSITSAKAKREMEAKKADDLLKEERKKSRGKGPTLVEVKSGQNKKTKTSYKQTRKEKAEKAVKHRKLKRTVWVFCLCLGVMAITLGCFKMAGALTPNGGIAAKVDDYNIKESDVTHYIEYNTVYKNYAKQQSTWGQMLSMYFGGAESFRKQIIEDKFVHDELVRRAADTEAISVSDQAVNDEVNKFKRQFKNDNAYKTSLSDSGYTEDSYRDYVYQSLLEKELTNKVITPKNPSDSDLASYINTNKTSYSDARHSAHILFNSNDKDKAQSVLNDINSGVISFENAQSQYSTDDKNKANGGDMGWDKFEANTYNYQHALSSLDAGKVNSELVTDQDGIHIVKCLEIWSPDKNATISSLDGIPTSLVDKFREEKIKYDQKTDLKTWLDTYKTNNNIDVVIYSMPSDVPYNVSSSNTNKSSTSTSTSTSTEQ